MISTRRLRLRNRTGAFPSRSLHRPQRRRAERRISASDGGGHPRLVKAHVEHESRGVPRRPDLHSTTAHPSHPGHSTRTCSTRSKTYTGHRVPFESSLRVDISRPPNVSGLSCAGRAKRGPRQLQAVVGQLREPPFPSLLLDPALPHRSRCASRGHRGGLCNSGILLARDADRFSARSKTDRVA